MGGDTGTRERILRAARRRLRDEGYHHTTLRTVAADAGVDVALVPYYFGSKRGLFAAALELPRIPSDALRVALAHDAAHLPEALLRTVVQTWDDPHAGTQLRLVVADVVAGGSGGHAFQEYIEREVHAHLVAALGGRRATERAASAVAVIIGLVFGRYVLVLGPFAQMSADDVVRTLGPVMRAALSPRR